MANNKKKSRGRQGGLQVATLCISTSMVLILLGMVVLTVFTARNLSSYVKEKLTVTMLLGEDITDSEAQQLCGKLSARPYISKLEYISKEQVLEEQKESMGTDPSEFAGVNPFVSEIDFQLAAEYANNDSLQWISKELKQLPKVTEITYPQDLIDSVNKTLRKISLVLLILAGLLLFVSFALINNTVFHLLNFEKHSSFPDAVREAAINNDFQLIILSEEFNPVLTVETRHLVKIEDAVQAARKLDAFSMTGFTRVEIEGVVTYWGFINIKDKRYILVIVDNEDEYSAAEMSKLAQTIELAIGMWKYTPDRDSRAEFIKSAVRGDISFCHTLLDESGLRGMQFTCAFYIRNAGD